jgi:hypothetical protein
MHAVACAMALTLLCLTIAPARAAEPPELILPMMVFTDMGHLVHVQGTLTGEGLGYKNNHVGLTCYREKAECLEVLINTAGSQVFSPGLPIVFDVRLWTADRIIADLAAPRGRPPNAVFAKEWQATVSETWIVDRVRQTAEFIDHPCNEARTYHWTIEDPPFWRRVKEGRQSK